MSKFVFKTVSEVLKLPFVTPSVKICRVGNAGIVTLDSLKNKNAMGVEMVLGHYTAIKELESSCKLVINKSASINEYSSGGDLKQMAEATTERFTHGYHHIYKVQHLLACYKTPYVSLVSGLTYGGATGLFITGKYRVVTEKTAYCAPEIFVGNFIDCGQTFFYSQLNQNLATYLALTATKVTGYDLKTLGLATHFVESKNFPELESKLTTCENHEQVEKVLSNFSVEKPNHVAKYEKDWTKIDKLFSGNSVEEIIERLQMDGSDWSANILMLMSRASPLSLKVSHKIIRLSQNKSLHECCELQFTLNRHLHDRGDLCEGGRAYIIDKDKNPSWAPEMGILPFKLAYLLALKFKYPRNKVIKQTLSKLEALTPEIIDSFFVPFPKGFEPGDDRVPPEIQFKTHPPKAKV